MIWLVFKRWLFARIIHFMPCWIVRQPETSWRYRICLWVYVNDMANDYDIYEYGQPLRITPRPGEDEFPF